MFIRNYIASMVGALIIFNCYSLAPEITFLDLQGETKK